MTTTEQVQARNFKPGMVVVMDGRPVAELDHKVKTARNSGTVSWAIIDLVQVHKPCRQSNFTANKFFEVVWA